MEPQSSTVKFNENEVHLLRVGNGSKLLIAFHGFGNDAELFMPLAYALKDEYTVIAVDLPGHGGTKWHAKYFTPEDLMAVISGIKERFLVEKITLLGYSLGGRVAMQAVQMQPHWFDRLVLIASDGLQKNFWYGFATRNWLGKRIFKKVLTNPEQWIKYFEWLYKFKLVDASRYKFAQLQLRNASVLTQVRYVWPVTSKLKVHVPALKWQLKRNKIFVALVMGKHDRVFPYHQGEVFVKGLKLASLTVLDTGHELIKPQFLRPLLIAIRGNELPEKLG